MTYSLPGRPLADQQRDAGLVERVGRTRRRPLHDDLALRSFGVHFHGASQRQVGKVERKASRADAGPTKVGTSS